MLQNTPADLDLHVTLLGKEWRPVVSAKDLGVYVDATLSFDDAHITSVTSSCLSSLSQINSVKHLLERNTLFNVINALVFSKLYYCSSIWSSTTKKNINKLQNVQNFAATLSLFLQNWNGCQSNPCLSTRIGYSFLSVWGDWPLTISLRSSKRGLKFTIKTRNKNKMDITGYRTAAGQRTFHYEQFRCGIPYPKGSLS